MSIGSITGQRSNSALTLKGLNTSVLYGNYLKTTNNNMIDINTLTTIPDLTSRITTLENDVINIKSDLGMLDITMSSIMQNTSIISSDLSSLTMDVQTDLIAPLYQDINLISNMSALTSYIDSVASDVDTIPKIDRFEGIIDVEVSQTNAVITEYDIKLRDMKYTCMEALPENLLNVSVARLYIYSRNNTDPIENKFNDYYNMALNFSTDFQSYYTSKLTGIFFPERVFNKNDRKWYKLWGMKNRINTTPCDLSMYSRNSIGIHIPKLRPSSAGKVFYQLFDSSTSQSWISLYINKVFIISYTDLTTDNYKYASIYTRYHQKLLKSQDLRAGTIYICPEYNSFINWSNVTTDDKPAVLSIAKVPSEIAGFPATYGGDSTAIGVLYTSLTHDSTLMSYLLLDEMN